MTQSKLPPFDADHMYRISLGAENSLGGTASPDAGGASAPRGGKCTGAGGNLSSRDRWSERRETPPPKPGAGKNFPKL